MAQIYNLIPKEDFWEGESGSWGHQAEHGGYVTPYWITSENTDTRQMTGYSFLVSMSRENFAQHTDTQEKLERMFDSVQRDGYLYTSVPGLRELVIAHNEQHYQPPTHRRTDFNFRDED